MRRVHGLSRFSHTALARIFGFDYHSLARAKGVIKAGKRVAGIGTWRIDGVTDVADATEAVALVFGD